MTDQSTHVFLKVTIPDAQRTAFRDVMKELVAEAETEPGTLMYEWYFNEAGDTCFIHERYRDQASGDLHVKNFADNYAARFFATIAGIEAQVYGKPSDYVRSALAAAEPTYLSQVAGFNRF